MKDYFAFISNPRVTQVTKSNSISKLLLTKDSIESNSITCVSGSNGNGGNTHKMLPVVPLRINREVTEKDRQKAALPLLPAVTLQNDEYEERAAIKQFDGGLSQEQAERGAICEIIELNNYRT